MNNYIEKYILKSGDNTKQQINTLNRWLKEIEYNTEKINEDITKLILRLKELSHDKQEIKRHKEILINLERLYTEAE